MMMRSLALMMALAGLAACGGEADGAAEAGAGVAAIATAAAEQGEAPITATRAEVEQAWKCRGVMGAAFAARTVIKDGLPAEVPGITSDTAMYWTDRAARLRAPDMTEAELDGLTASSVRVLATAQAIENALPEIRECLAAQGAG
jgi:hypothetical protein